MTDHLPDHLPAGTPPPELTSTREALAHERRLLAALAHEMVSPLRAVLGTLQALRADGLTLEQESQVRRAARAAGTLLEALDEASDLARLAAGELALDAQPFAVAQLAAEVDDILQGCRGERAVALRIEIDPSLPPALVGDRRRLRQVLVNLGTNALSATRHGEVVVRLALFGHVSDGIEADLSVSDTGSGLSEPAVAVLPQSHGVRRLPGMPQAGLGLMLCRDLARLMGSGLQVSSEPGRGSRFSLRVRLGVAAQVPSWSHGLKGSAASAQVPRPGHAQTLKSMAPVPAAPVSPAAAAAAPAMAAPGAQGQPPTNWQAQRAQHLVPTFVDDLRRLQGALPELRLRVPDATLRKSLRGLRTAATWVGAQALAEAAARAERACEGRDEPLDDHTLGPLTVAIEDTLQSLRH